MFNDLQGDPLYIRAYDTWLMETDEISNDNEAIAYNRAIALEDVRQDLMMALGTNDDSILNAIYERYGEQILKRALSIKQLIYGFSQHINGENYAFEQVARLENEYKRYRNVYSNMNYINVSDTKAVSLWL